MAAENGQIQQPPADKDYASTRSTDSRVPWQPETTKDFRSLPIYEPRAEPMENKYHLRIYARKYGSCRHDQDYIPSSDQNLAGHCLL